MVKDAVFFSIIIPVYNRPRELVELLHSLTKQVYTHFEVLIVDDGSEPPAFEAIEGFSKLIDLRYFYIPNGGQGFARNYGFNEAKGDYFIVFDSDCIIPANYLQVVSDGLDKHQLDAFGGPDAAHPSFTSIQKAINYAMTSPLTTGGIRGNAKHIGVFHPRSFNMGLSRQTWKKTGGFQWTNQSEDMELSMRMQSLGLKVGLLGDARVFHKRRVNWTQYFKQTFSFGQGRIRLYRHFGKGLKLIHFLPAFFTLGLVLLAILGLSLALIVPGTAPYNLLGFLFLVGTSIYGLYTLAIFIHAWITTAQLPIALNSLFAVYIQFLAYGSGFIKDFIQYLILQRGHSPHSPS